MFALDAAISGKPAAPGGPTKRACTLYPMDADGEGAPVEVRPLPFFLGKHEECHFVLTGEGIMRKHTKIRLQDGEFFVTDLATYLGTFLNGQSVVESVIKDGDILRIGDYKMRVAIREVVAAPDEEAKRSAPKGPSLARRAFDALREVGAGSWTALVLALLALGGGIWSYQRWQEKERIRTQDLELPAIDLREGESKTVAVAQVSTASVGKSSVAVIQAVPEGIVVEAVNEGVTEVVCLVPEQGKRHFAVLVHRPADPIDRYPELKGTLTLGPFERSKRAEEYIARADADYAERERDLANRGRALRGYTLAVVILESLQEKTTLLEDAKAKKKLVDGELNKLWDDHFSLLNQAHGNGDDHRARNEAWFLLQLFPEGSGMHHDVARIWFDQLK